MIGQLKLCRMRLPYRQPQQERACRAPRSQVGNTHGSYSVAAMIRPPEMRTAGITREQLCWDCHRAGLRGYVQFNKYAYIHTCIHTSLIPPCEDQCEWHRMTRMTGPDCTVMCNLMNIHTYIHTYTHIHTYIPLCRV